MDADGSHHCRFWDLESIKGLRMFYSPLQGSSEAG